MFRPALTPTFWAKCQVEYTDADGRKVPGVFEVQYNRYDRDRVDALNKEIRDQIKNGEELQADAEFLRNEVVAFRGVEIPAEFNDGVEIGAGDTAALLEYLLRAGFGQAMTQTFFRESPKARAKN